jgi:chromosome transmission fidelity protein 4
MAATDPPGPTFLAYTPDGSKLITAGSNNVIRVYETGSDGEPTNIDDCLENNLAVAATVRGTFDPPGSPSS